MRGNYSDINHTSERWVATIRACITIKIKWGWYKDQAKFLLPTRSTTGNIKGSEMSEKALAFFNQDHTYINPNERAYGIAIVKISAPMKIFIVLFDCRRSACGNYNWRDLATRRRMSNGEVDGHINFMTMSFMTTERDKMPEYDILGSNYPKLEVMHATRVIQRYFLGNVKLWIMTVTSNYRRGKVYRFCSYTKIK